MEMIIDGAAIESTIIMSFLIAVSASLLLLLLSAVILTFYEYTVLSEWHVVIIKCKFNLPVHLHYGPSMPDADVLLSQLQSIFFSWVRISGRVRAHFPSRRCVRTA